MSFLVLAAQPSSASTPLRSRMSQVTETSAASPLWFKPVTPQTGRRYGLICTVLSCRTPRPQAVGRQRTSSTLVAHPSIFHVRGCTTTPNSCYICDIPGCCHCQPPVSGGTYSTPDAVSQCPTFYICYTVSLCISRLAQLVERVTSNWAKVMTRSVVRVG